MSVRMFRATIKPDRTAELEKAAQELFAALDAAQPEGVRYAWCKLADGTGYVLVVDLDDDANNPLLTVPEFSAVMDKLKNQWVSEPLAVQQMTPIGSYKLF
jgi:hypothetical protein